MSCLPDWMIERDVKIDPFSKGQVAKGVISFGLGSYGYDARIGYKFKIFTNTNCVEIDPKAFNDKAFVNVDLTPYIHNDLLYQGSVEAEHWYQCEYCPGFHDNKLVGKPCPYQPNHILIPPNSFALGESLETFTIPRDCLAVCLGKSTLARCGIIINVTPLEPEWTGKVTIEISNTAPLPARIYTGEGIMQVIFLRTDGRNEAMMIALDRFLGEISLHPERLSREASHAYDVLRLAQHKGGTCRTSYEDKKGKFQNQTGIQLPFVEKEDK